METQLTVRLPADLASKIKEKARRLRLKKSDIVRQAVIAYLEGPEEREYLIQKIRDHNFRN